MPNKIEYKVERTFNEKGPTLLDILFEFVNEKNRIADELNESKNSIFAGLWLLNIPIWKPFLKYVMNVQEVEIVF